MRAAGILTSVSSPARVTSTSDGEQACGAGLSQVPEGPPESGWSEVAWPCEERGVPAQRWPHQGVFECHRTGILAPGASARTARSERWTLEDEC